jgi:methylated-DNA-protein-cysteine methyltransferase related protein
MKQVLKYSSRDSAIYKVIWDVTQQIPKGKVSTYGKIAIVCGLIGQARRVGIALHNLPARLKVPWHRVVNSQGRISLPKAGGYYRKQKLFLQREGIVFKREKIDLKKFGWPPWLQDNARLQTKR